MSLKVSPFFSSGSVASNDSLAIIHLKRDHQVPTILRAQDEDDEGYAEGKVINTRFGSFPHKTLIGLPWGSQVRASKVDTGSRGRRTKGDSSKKRSRDDFEDPESEPREDTPTTEKEAVTASSGFIHLLAPTPENWTSSLPHRTQVVYTPDYSYILQRIRARPGSSLIEAGAGSGSFTHASARAVYNGYPCQGEVKKRKVGKVWSYEFHEQRHEKLAKELKDHGLDGVVEITHRDVCGEGFLVGEEKHVSPEAEAIFLDLPAPWLALPHLSRRPTPSSSGVDGDAQGALPSALSQTSPIHICTFSPCIEQVQRTISTMRQLGWVDIDMVEVTQKRIEIRRERIGIANGVERGVQQTAASVEEAVNRLREVEGRFKSYHANGISEGDAESTNGANHKRREKTQRTNPNSKEKILESLVDRKIYKEGRLVHRSEPELKTHTSYLVFAVLPREWTAEDEAKARERYPVKKRESGDSAEAETAHLSKRQLKKSARDSRKEKDASELTVTAVEGKAAEGLAAVESSEVVDLEVMVD